VVVRVQVKVMGFRASVTRGCAVALAMGLLAGCSRATTVVDAPTPPPPAEPTVPRAATALKPRAPVAVPVAPSASPVPEVKLLDWSRELDVSAAMLAVGKKRVAVLENGSSAGRYRGVRMRDLSAGAAWSDLVLPDRLQPGPAQQERLEVFFGRDDRPRLMGTRQGGEVATPRYYRYRGGWRDRTGEIARLEGGTGTLFGILGHDDPEVVCKLGEICIIKRLTGWTNVQVPQVEHHVEIAAGSAFAVARGSALRIDTGDQAWRPICESVPWTEPRGLWPFGDGTLWVVEDAALHHWDGKAWRTVKTPVPGARALWGLAPDDLWLAAREGVAHYDGDGWSRLSEPSGSFSHVIGTDTQLWVAGESGVWVALPSA
jgi:hypothetical protein